MMQELIVYRNPFEAFIWKVITSPVLWLVSLSCFCTVIIALSFESHTVDIKKKYLRIGFRVLWLSLLVLVWVGILKSILKFN